jgi:uncharacterized protein (TIGR01777 family)
MKVIITGGTGHIGRYLIDELLAHNHQIVVLSRNPAKYRGQFNEAVKLIEWDAKTAVGWAEEADGADAIINLAGESIAGENFLPARWSEAQKHKIKQSRLDAGAAVVGAVQAASQKPKVVLQASAVGYYGPRNDDAKLDESAPPGSDFLGRTCVEWEQSTSAVKALGVRQVLLRTGLIQMTEAGPLQRLLVQFKLFAGGPFGNGRQWWPWIHIKDEVQAIRFLLEKEDADGPYNLTAPTPETNKSFSKKLGRVLKRPSFIPVPGFAMKLLVGEVATVVLDGQRAVPAKLQEAGYSFKFTELEEALKDLIK